jgi:MoaA/NifB/PqqE/SkfB family radical SAM enzyme
MPTATTAILSTVVRNPRILKAKPSVNLFFLRYLRKFGIRNIGGQIIVHSHLPPLNSRAYSRFIDDHLLGKCAGPSHAQIAVTNACPQRCAYCYNRERRGVPLDTAAVRKTIARLKDMGVFWIGLTGGEPLLQRDLVTITEEAARDCAVKLFTTGCGLTPDLAGKLKKAGLFSVSVSLDHWTAEVHDETRGYPGAFQTALNAIDMFGTAGLHVGVSAVLTRDMIRNGETEKFLEYLRSLGLDEAWLSEAKPSAQAFWKKEYVITEEERRSLVALQNRANKPGRMTVNYLGHFEGPERFGCNAGWKMIYVDPFGEVSPCVFAPMTFGNVREQDVGDIWTEMRASFKPGSECFVNKNYDLFRKHFGGRIPLSKAESGTLMNDVTFGLPGKFLKLLYGKKGAFS